MKDSSRSSKKYYKGKVCWRVIVFEASNNEILKAYANCVWNCVVGRRLCDSL